MSPPAPCIGYAPRAFELTHTPPPPEPVQAGHYGPLHVHRHGFSHFGEVCSLCPEVSPEDGVHADLPALGCVRVDTDTVHGDPGVMRVPLLGADSLVLPRVLPYTPSACVGSVSEPFLAAQYHHLMLQTGTSQMPSKFLHDMYRALRNTEIKSTNELSQTLPATVKTVPATEYPFPVYLPTLALAVFPGAPLDPYAGHPGTIHTVHAGVLAEYCLSLPALPPARPRPYSADWHKCMHPTPEAAPHLKQLRAAAAAAAVDCPAVTALALPVLPLPLPDPASFPALVGFMYNPSAVWLLGELLDGLDGGVRHALVGATTPAEAGRAAAAAHAWTVGAPACVLLAAVGRVEGVWENACALGIGHGAVWCAVDVAWGVLTRGIATRGEELGRSRTEERMRRLVC